MRLKFFKQLPAIKSLIGVTAVGCLIAASGLIFTGCSRESGDTSQSLIIFDEKAFLAEIAESDSLFDLAEVERDYKSTKQQSKSINKALDKKWQELMVGVKPIGPISEEAELIAFNSENALGGRVKMSYLFKVKQNITDDYKIYQHAFPKKKYREVLPESQKKCGFVNWGFFPRPPTSSWKPGEYIVVTTEPAPEPAVYNLRIGFGKRGGGGPGMELDLGEVDVRKKK